MCSNHLCPFCSFPLLSHIRGGKLYWFCQSCIQEVPYGIYQRNYLLKNSSENEQILPTLTQGNVLNNFQKNMNIKELFFGQNIGKFLMTIQQFLAADRVILCQLDPTGKMSVIAESLLSGCSTTNKSKVNHFLSLETLNKLHHGKTEFISDLSENSEPESLGTILASIFSLKSQLTIPIRVRDETQKCSFLWGIIIAHTCYKIAEWNRKQINLCELIAQQIGLSIEQESRYIDLSKLIHYDEFTNLANRHYFEDILDQKWQYLSKLNLPISLVICELKLRENWQLIQDKENQNNYQQQIINILKNSLPNIDNLVAHYREQSFVILLPNYQYPDQIVGTIKSEFTMWKKRNHYEEITNYLELNLGFATVIPHEENLPESLIIAAHDHLNKQKKQEQKLNQLRQIKEVKTPKIDQVTKVELLMSYLAYFLSRGKTIITPHQGKITFEGDVYQYNGYDYNFVNFWQKLTQIRDFPEFYLEGDTHNFGEFLTGNYTVNSCSRCNLPIPIPVGAALDIPSCNLCENKQITKEYKIVIFGEKSIYTWEKLLRINGFKCYIFSDPDSFAKEDVNWEIDLILIDAEISPNLVKNWQQKLAQSQQLKDVPIIALTKQASQVLPWQEQELELIDYLLIPLNGEYLAEHLRKISQLDSSLSKNKLHWFPK